MIIPPGNRILIIADDPLVKNDSKIKFLVDPKPSELGRGTVYSVGSLIGDLKEGDKVVFKKYLGRPTELEGNIYLRFLQGEIEGLIK